MKLFADILAAIKQASPGFNDIVKAVETVGFPIVISVLLLLIVVTPVLLLSRSIVGGIGKQITLLAGTLSAVSNRQEVAADKIVEHLQAQTTATQDQGKLIGQMYEAIRIQLNFTSQQMAQQAALTQQVAHVAANTDSPIVTGVIKPVTPEEKTP